LLGYSSLQRLRIFGTGHLDNRMTLLSWHTGRRTMQQQQQQQQRRRHSALSWRPRARHEDRHSGGRLHSAGQRRGSTTNDLRRALTASRQTETSRTPAADRRWPRQASTPLQLRQQLRPTTQTTPTTLRRRLAVSTTADTDLSRFTPHTAKNSSSSFRPRLNIISYHLYIEFAKFSVEVNVLIAINNCSTLTRLNTWMGRRGK